MNEISPLDQFTRTAEIASDRVIRMYSTSFGMATRLLGKRHRQHVRNIYAMVRVADEIVDGVAEEAGLTRQDQVETLDRYVADVHRAMRVGYASDFIIHTFARTAHTAGIDETLTGPFFDSMRADLGAVTSESEPHPESVTYDETAHAQYVHGSAEVVGMMCLRVFTRDETLSASQKRTLEHGASQLGAAFQNINFLRDLGDDTGRLGRSYLGASGKLTDTERDAWVQTIRIQLTDASSTIPFLPRDARAAVRSALALFSALTDRVAKTPAATLYRVRVRVPNHRKAFIAAQAFFTTCMERFT
ncbi:MAG: phytoene/squalene synthase family protein [Leucobacter sp.]